MPDQAEGTAAWLWPQTQRLGLPLRIQPLGARLRMVQKSLSAGVEVEPFSAVPCQSTRKPESSQGNQELISSS